MTDEQIKHLVNRFLMWKLPANFSPDNGISFEPEFNKEWNAKQGKPPQRREPVGTNLLDAIQAETMVRHMLDGLPNQMASAQPGAELVPHETGEETDVLAAKLAALDGLNWHETCSYEADADGEFCNSSTCVAAYYEDHDPAVARYNYRKYAAAALHHAAIPEPAVSIADLPGWFQLWFFRDIVDEQRKAFFLLSGLDPEAVEQGMRMHGHQRVLLKHVCARTPLDKAKSQGGAE